jgi:hypothetical protein
MTPNKLPVAALLMPGLARADAGAGDLGTAVAVAYACIYYLVLCLFSIPLSLLLRGSKLKRIAIGLVVPIIGVGLGALTLAWLERMPWTFNWLELKPYMRYVHYVTADREAVFYVISSIPMALLIIWVIVSRARASAFERSRVRYANFLKRAKDDT